MPIPIDRKKIQPFGRLELLASQAVEGFITGLHKSPFHGFSVEFAEHRLHNPGESTRHIDWKLAARTDKLFVKRYEEETNLRCHILLDTSSSMFFPEGVDPVGDDYNKIKFSLYGAASLIQLLKRQRDAVGLSFFDEELYLHTQARSSATHIRYLYSEMEQLLDTVSSSPDKKTAATDALHELAEAIHKRSLVVIFSDMMDNSERAEEIFAALQHLRHNKHEVVLFNVMDGQKEMEFDYENRPYTFTDLESGEQVKVNPVDVRDHYLKHIQEFRKELKVKCGQYRIDFVEVDINEGFNEVLMQYLIKRQKMV